MTTQKRDRKYILERGELIPLAEKYANALVPPLDPKRSNKDDAEKYGHKWNAVFHARMEELWNERSTQTKGDSEYGKEAS